MDEHNDNHFYSDGEENLQPMGNNTHIHDWWNTFIKQALFDFECNCN